MKISWLITNLIMSQKHLWELNSGMVESDDADVYDSWRDFKNTCIWKSNYYCGCLPVYWSWLNFEYLEQQGEWDLDEDEPSNILYLFYLELAPTKIKVIQINLKEENEVEVAKWLKEHHFHK